MAENIGFIPPETIPVIKENMKKEEQKFVGKRKDIVKQSQALKLEYIEFKTRKKNFLRSIGELAPAKRVKKEDKK